MKNPFRKNVEKPVEPVHNIPEIDSTKATSKLDATQFYFGYDFKLNDRITIRQPTLGEIIEMGEEDYYKMIFLLTSIPSDHMAMLWDAGRDFMNIRDIEFFLTMTRQLPKNSTDILFGNQIDFSKFDLYGKDNELLLYDKGNQILLTEEDYTKMWEFICRIHHIKKTHWKAAGPLAKRAMIEQDRLEKQERMSKKYTSTLIPLASSMINHPGFKYNLAQLLNLKIFFFMDCVSRISTKESMDKLATGYFTGNIDTKKFNPETQLNWMKDLYDK